MMIKCFLLLCQWLAMAGDTRKQAGIQNVRQTSGVISLSRYSVRMFIFVVMHLNFASWFLPVKIRKKLGM